MLVKKKCKNCGLTVWDTLERIFEKSEKTKEQTNV
jgi:hypothetical protein